MTDLNLPVAEVFGPTIQGEGPYAGRAVQFVRLGGCNLSCTWCFAPDTPVLMADWTERPLSAVQVGDLVMSYRNRRYETARVEQVMERHAHKRVAVITDDTEVVCTPDHVFATARHLDGRRRCRADKLEGRHVRAVRSQGWSPDETVRTDGWWTGWAQGLILGDGHVSTGQWPKVWLRVCDRQLADAYCRLANQHGARCTVREQSRRTSSGKQVYSVAHTVSSFPDVVGLPSDPDEIAGFLAGFFDAEGYVGVGQIQMSQKHDKTLDRVYGMVQSLGIPATIRHSTADRVGSVTVNGAANVDAFMRLTRPVLDRKRTAHQSRPQRMLTATPVRHVKHTHPGPVVNLTTSTGFFIAGGLLVEQCDTPYTWDASRFNLRQEAPLTPVQDVIDQLAPDLPVILTGGEPLLHRNKPAFEYLLHGLTLHGHGRQVHVETNGTLAPPEHLRHLIEHYSVSPKLPNAGQHKKSQNPEPWDGWHQLDNACFKYVAATPDDVKLAVEHADRHNMPRTRVWIMPEGVDTDTLLGRWTDICDAALQHGVNASQRLHVLAWGDTKGT